MTITRTGIELGVGSVALVILGSVAGYPELVLIGAVGAAAVAGAVGWAARLRLRLAVSRSITPEQPRAGQAVTVRLLVTNQGARSSPGLSTAERVGETTVRLEIPPIAPADQVTIPYQVPAVRRGRLLVEPARIGCRDPLGLAGATVMVGERSEIRVYPDWHPEVGPLAAQGLDPGIAETARLPRADVVFHSLRDYQPGDPLRMIHWRATARRVGGWPVVRELGDPEEPVQVLLLDTAASAYHPDAFEEAVRVFASLAMAASRRGLSLELRTTGDGMLLADEPSSPRAGPLTILDPLCDIEQSVAAAGLAETVHDLADTLPAYHPNAVVGVIAGLGSEAAAGALTRAALTFEAVYLIRVGAGSSPVQARGVVHVDVETSSAFGARIETGRPQ